MLHAIRNTEAGDYLELLHSQGRRTYTSGNIKSYPSTFLRVLAECVRIKMRSKEKGVVVLNSKSGDFGTYSLPRLSLNDHDQEREPQAPAHSDLQTGDERREPRRVDVPILNARKGKIKCKKKI